ncbi:MAG: hypothetical protein ABI569_12530 [Casimicrobiaceae bacterium]
MRLRELIYPVLLAAVSWTGLVHAEKTTVCTITVNSADEKEAFRRHLPADKFQFVELVERGRPDWLASACRAGVHCDMLIVSGHYDGGHEFFSEHVEANEFLPVAELERVSCSDSCPGLFSRLKEVYLFGCNTLNAEARRTADDLMRGLVAGGLSRADADRTAQSLNARYGESSRDRLRLVFKDVPVIYGFSSVAPLGPTAAGILDRYFRAAGTSDLGTGRPSPRMLAQFSTHSLTVTRGMSDSDALAGTRRDVCQFADDRLSDALKISFIHQLLQRPLPEVRMIMDRIEHYLEGLDDFARQEPDVEAALSALAQDAPARARYLAYARDVEPPAARVRMLELARDLGWLTPEQWRNEVGMLLGEFLARDALGLAEVDLACTLNRDGDFDALAGARSRDSAAHTAVRACLGSEDDRVRVLAMLTSASAADARIAQTYLRHRRVATTRELRGLIVDVVQARDPEAQTRALVTLASQDIADPEVLDELARLFPVAGAAEVQSAIAGVLIRADITMLARADLAQTLRQTRLRASGGDDVIGALIRRLQARP